MHLSASFVARAAASPHTAASHGAGAAAATHRRGHGVAQRREQQRPRRCVAARFARGEPAAPAAEAAWSGGDFYSILGTHPAALPREIKAAYHALMRMHHPDTTTTPNAEATAFAALLNQIYQTLADPDSRALYDALAGLSEGAVNPFTDTAFPADQVFVDEVSCIGCGRCVRACPSAFFIEGSKYGRASIHPGADVMALQEEVEEAILTCPVDCIHWVTSPQLALLESALAGMERVDAFIMLRAHRSAGNVFEVAHRAWQKRQATVAALREKQAFAAAGGDPSGSTSGWSFWTQHVEVKRGGGSAGGGDTESFLRDPAARRVAELASAASRALRRFQLYQALCVPVKALTDGRSSSSGQ